MRILWQSSTPECVSGYGNVTRHAVTRLVADGHFVRVATKHHHSSGWSYWTIPGTDKRIEICDGTNIRFLNEMIRDEKFDLVYTLWDIWGLNAKRPITPDRWLAHIPIDTDKIHNLLGSISKTPGVVASMSKHGERELKSLGFDPLYAPLGIDTNKFRFKPDARQEVRNQLGIDKHDFLLGSVGLNYQDDRKNFINLFWAFKKLRENVKMQYGKKAFLFLHTCANENDTYPDAINYKRIADQVGISDALFFPLPQSAYLMGRLDEDFMADIYSAMDGYVQPSKGEGFGLPLVEALACGLPVSATDTTSMPELSGPCGDDYSIKTDVFDDSVYLGAADGWRTVPRPSAILAGITKMFEDWINCPHEDHEPFRYMNRRWAYVNYGWDSVWPAWVAMFNEADQRLRAIRGKK